MNARIRLTWMKSNSPNLSKQTLEVVGNGKSWGIHELALADTIDILSPASTTLQVILRSYNQSGQTGDEATVDITFQVPASSDPTPPVTPTPNQPDVEPLTLPAEGLQAQLINWE